MITDQFECRYIPSSTVLVAELDSDRHEACAQA